MKILKCLSPFLAFLLLAPLGQLRAQVGGDNPTGPFGIFNGNVTTGCSYDPYTGNAMRSIPDISVAGAVGRYGLALSRTYNSRDGIGSSFGFSGWRHSYEWTMDDSAITNTQNAHPTSYSVNFPDGRNEIFTYSPSDIYFRAGEGIRERLQPLNLGTMLAYLVLPDGGKIEFRATQQSEYDGELHVWSYWYTYVAQAIIDPYGQRTTLTYNPDGTLQKVTEPAGRTLQFYYITVGSNTVIDHVTGSDGRTVQYSYIQSAFSPGTTVYVVLDHVVYYGDATWTARYRYRAPNTGSANGVPLLWTCDDPMYPGPMRRIGYTYATGYNGDGSAAVYGQILSENYYDGTNVGAAVTTLSVNNNTRTETRADGHTRTFTYANAMLTSATDFIGVAASQGYDSNGYINLVADRNGHTTNFTCNAITGAVTQVQFPAAADVTPSPAPRGTVTYTYGNASCADPNNQDANNPYYLCSVTDEGGHATVFTRDTNKRVTRIDYPDGGLETFVYNGFGEVTAHQMTTGGIETFTYDGRGLKQTYCDPYHANGNPPSAWYQYDTLDRLSGVTDALGSALGDLNHTTNYAYNSRGQVTVTTHPIDPTDGQRHTIANAYNPDGTLASTTDQLSHVTSYTYDDYRRPLTVTTPGHNTPVTAYSYYDANGTGNDYTHTDSNVTHVTLPSGNKSTTTYNANLQKTSVTVGVGTYYAATTSYGYDYVGNVTSVVSPNEQPGGPYAGQSAISTYDERNRLMSVRDALNNPTSFQYDTSGRKKTVTRANGQIITYDSYDVMNRLLQQTVKQTPNPDAVTRYTYYTSGQLRTMQDPYLVAIGSGQLYGWTYDLMGRKIYFSYPVDSYNWYRTEYFTYDTAGRLNTFTNRAGNVQTFQYDNRNRETRFDWNDGVTPWRGLGYDAASNVVACHALAAYINFVYYNDNTLRSQEEWTGYYNDLYHRTITYTYDPDGHRATMQYPSGRTFSFDYTPRGEPLDGYETSAPGSPFQFLYGYDASGNRTFRGLNGSQTFNWSGESYTTYHPDGLDRPIDVQHYFTGDSRRFQYAYDTVSNRKYEMRDWSSLGDGFQYDLAGQVIGYQREGTVNPDGTVTGGTNNDNLYYDANGNRTSVVDNNVTTTYGTVNNLNQYPTVGGAAATYDANGNLKTYNGWTYTYDAQNRLTQVSSPSTSAYFWYDGLNRVITWMINGNVTFPVWDGWDLAEDYKFNNVLDTSYLHGAGSDELVSMTRSGQTYYFYQDGRGNTSQLSDPAGHLLESYKYDLTGNPSFYDGAGNPRTSSAYNNRFLFTGREYYQELGLYNYRNRFYSPALNRFLQADPIGFGGDPTNLYRYCGNNPANRSDPNGTYAVPDRRGWYTYLVNPGWQSYVGNYVPGSHGWCAAGAQILSDMPKTDYWFQGASLTSATTPGTVIATGWQDGGYPSLEPGPNPGQYGYYYGANATVNHTAIFLNFDKYGNAWVLDQYEGKTLDQTKIPPGKQWQWNEVYVAKQNGNYDSGGATGRGGGGNTFNTTVPSIIGGVFYPFGFGNISPGMNFGGGTAGTIQRAFTWTTNDSTNSPTLSNFGDINIGAGVGPGEPIDFEAMGYRNLRRGGDLEVIPHG